MPTGRGGNLTQPLKKVLINQASPDNLITYRDIVTGLQVLHFPQDGYTIPWTGAGAVNVQFPQAPVMKVVAVQLSNVAPLNPLNYSYGVNIIKRVAKPGVDNSEYFPHLKYYGGQLTNITTPVIANAELNAMRDDIVAQINADRGITRRPAYQHPGAAVFASLGTVLTTWNAASEITLDGDAVGPEASLADFIDAINDLGPYLAVEDANTAGNVFVVRLDGNPIVFAQVAGTADVLATNGQFFLVQRYPDATFEVRVEPTLGTADILNPGSFAFLTNDEVFQVFSHIPNRGFLAQETWPDKLPIRNAAYVRINIDVQQEHYDLGGASHDLMFTTAIELYMPLAEWDIAAAAAVNRRWAAVAGNAIMLPGNGANVRDVFALWQA